MALRVLGSKCRVCMTSAKEGAIDVSHVYCESKRYGVKCRLDGVPGKKPYVLSGDCFQPADSAKKQG